jgi:hypothetical protein
MTEPAPYAVNFEIDLNRLAVGSRYAIDRHGEPMDGEPIHLLDLVIERAARMLVDKMEHRDYVNTRAEVRKELQSVIVARLDALVGEAMTGTLRRTDEWGKPRGEPTTLNDVILTEARDWMAGGPSVRDGRRQTHGLKKLVAEEVDARLKGEMKEEIDAAKAKVRARVAEVSGEELAKVVARAVGS